MLKLEIIVKLIITITCLLSQIYIKTLIWFSRAEPQIFSLFLITQCLIFSIIYLVFFSSATNAGVIAGATVGCIVGVVLILLVIFFLWTRRKDTEDDIANEIK